jgi:hypothetical protein
MRRIALLAACLIASAVLALMLVPARASALTAATPAPGLDKGALHQSGVVHVRRGGFRGGGFRGFRGGAWHGRGFRGARVYGGGWRGGRAWRGGRVYGWRGGRAWRGGRVYGWRGGRRYGWRRPGWGWGVAALATAPFLYGGYRYGNCPLVRRTVWTPRGYRVRWVRRCW